MPGEELPSGARQRKVFTLLVEMRCNSYCVFCGQRQVDEGLVKARRSLGLSIPPTNYGDLRGRYTLETATSTLARARDEGYTQLSLQGGEPTLFPDLAPLVATAKRLGFEEIGVVTNGRRLKDEAFARALLEAGLDAITFSVLGHDSKTHDALAIAPGSYAELTAGLENARRIASELGREVTVNVNLITTKDTLPHLEEQVRALAHAGAQAASMHLVRFDGLAAEPKVQDALAFDARALTAEIAKGWRAADRTAMSLHATDIPVCLHPELRAIELELLERRAAVSRHHYAAAAFEYESRPSGRPHVPSCSGCLLAAVCPRVPPEYLWAEPSETLRPITASSLAAKVDLHLARLDPTHGSSPARVQDVARSVAILARLAAEGTDLSAVRERIDDALGDLAVLALSRGDAPMIAASFGARLGLQPPRWTRKAVLGAARADLQQLARSAEAIAEDRAGDLLRLQFARGFEIALEGAEQTSHGSIRYARARPVARRLTSRADRLLLSIFLGCFAPTLRRSSGVRITGETIDVELDGRWMPAWAREKEGEARFVGR